MVACDPMIMVACTDSALRSSSQFTRSHFKSPINKNICTVALDEFTIFNPRSIETKTLLKLKNEVDSFHFPLHHSRHRPSHRGGGGKQIESIRTACCWVYLRGANESSRKIFQAQSRRHLQAVTFNGPGCVDYDPNDIAWEDQHSFADDDSTRLGAVH